MNRLALGTVQFGLPYGIANQIGQVSREEAKAILQSANANGIDTLDTAIAYGDSELCLGELGVQDFKIVTKLPELPDDCPNVHVWVQQQFNSSLSRLGVKTVYGLLLHQPLQLLGSNGVAIYTELLALKGAGKVKKIGVSIYSPDELELLMPKFNFDLIQAPFNLIDQRLNSNGLIRRLKDKDVEIHTRSAFLQGLLLMPKTEIPTKFLKWDSIFKKWHQWLESHDVTAVQACLAFPLSFPEIDRIVIGADSLSQFEQIISAANSPLNVIMANLNSDDEILINPANWNQL